MTWIATGTWLIARDYMLLKQEVAMYNDLHMKL